jgi:AraC family transcriptional regulator
MDATTLRAVERSIRAMHENLGERITIDDMARAAMFSKFHYSRVFARITGVSPGRFLSAVRIQEAKRLLLSTSITVADIGHRVGYNSIGTFSSRFSSSVGLSPIAYRRRGRSIGRVPGETRPVPASEGSTTIRGQAHGIPPELSSPVFVGLFPGPIPEGPPVRHTVLAAPGPYTLPEVPAGTWHLVAHAIGRDTDGHEQRCIGSAGPITTTAGLTARLADVRLHPLRLVDPPLLLALPDLRAERVLDAAS